MKLCHSGILSRPAAHKPSLEDQQIGITVAPTAAVSTPVPFGFVEAGQQDVFTLSPSLKTVLQEQQVMAARQGAGNTPGVAAHGRIQPFSLEIKIIQRNHLDGKVECLCGGFNPLAQGGLAASRQGTESEQTTFSPPLIPQAQQGKTDGPQPIRRRFGVPLINRYSVTLGVALSSEPMVDITKPEVLKQPLLVAVGNDALALRIQL